MATGSAVDLVAAGNLQAGRDGNRGCGLDRGSQFLPLRAANSHGGWWVRLRQQEDDGLGDAGRLGLALDLDRVRERELLAGGDVGDLDDDRRVPRTREPTGTGWGKRTLLTP